MEIVTQAKPSVFAYPPALKPPTDEKIEKVATAVLSTTAKAKARQKKKDADKKEDGKVESSTDAMEVDTPAKAGDKMDVDEPKALEVLFLLLTYLFFFQSLRK